MSLVVLLQSCTPVKQQYEVAVVLAFKGQPVNCNSLIVNEQNWTIHNLAFYLSDFYVSRSSDLNIAQSNHGKEQKVHQISLVRFDQVTCQGRFRFSVESLASEKQFLHFTLGLPFTLNHQNPVTQPSPLNEPDMFWTWRTGYKFFRIDMESDLDSWAWHLGSVGCHSVAAVRAPEKNCEQPNLTRHALSLPDSSSFKMVLHLDRLLSGVSLKKQQRCVMHGPAESACPILFTNLESHKDPVFSFETF